LRYLGLPVCKVLENQTIDLKQVGIGKRDVRVLTLDPNDESVLENEMRKRFDFQDLATSGRWAVLGCGKDASCSLCDCE